MRKQQQYPFCDSLRSDLFEKYFEQVRFFYTQLLFRYIYNTLLIVFIIAFSHTAFSDSDPDHSIIKYKAGNLIKNVYFYDNKKIAEADKTGVTSVDNSPLTVPDRLNKSKYNLKYRLKFHRVKKILLNHFRASTDDPQYIKQDIIELSRYYVQFPDVLKLLDQLNNLPWSFQYRQHTSLTKATGTALSIRKVEIFIDTRGGAQYKKHRSCAGRRICTAPPSDVLLHELIHTHIMLTTNQFIEDGGMNTMLYPYRHEYNVIKLEAELYARMTRIDKLKRPLRHSHKGKYVLASCVTCVH